MNRIQLTAMALALAALAGCAPEKNATSARLDDLQREISRLKANSIALAERLDAVESETPASEEDASLEALGKAQAETTDERPQLDVVRLAPKLEEAPESETPSTALGDAEDPAHDDHDRPVISGAGQRVEQVAPPTTTPRHAPGGRR